MSRMVERMFRNREKNPVTHKLDYILSKIYEAWEIPESRLNQSIRAKYLDESNSVNPVERKALIDFLIDDGYIRVDERQYVITLKGIIFFEQGAYSNQQNEKQQNKLVEEQQRRQNRQIARLTLIAGIGTAIAGVYSFFELLDRFFHIYPSTKPVLKIVADSVVKK